MVVARIMPRFRHVLPTALRAVLVTPVALRLTCTPHDRRFIVFALSLFAQTSGFHNDRGAEQSWITTTDLKSDDLGPQRIPVRIIESHSQNGNRTIDKRSIQIRGSRRPS